MFPHFLPDGRHFLYLSLSARPELEQSNGTSYLVMDLVAGETLAERVKREGALLVEEALAICKQIVGQPGG